MKTLKYSRNWAYEDMFEVHFVDGTVLQLYGQTDNKGRIGFIDYNGHQYTPEQFDMLEIESVHYRTPAKLEVKTSINVLVEVYLRLGRTISEGDTMQKARVRSLIADEIYKRGFNLHDLMSEHQPA